MFGKLLPGKKNRKVETSLIEEFKYPKLGPGQLWEIAADEVVKHGGKILKNCKVVKIHKNEENKITGVTYETDGQEITLEADILLSSMPVKDLVEGMGEAVPADVLRIASGLPYRDYITVGLLVNKLKLENKTKVKTLTGNVPDCWIYVQERQVKLGRLQLFNNWSPYMVKDPENTMWIGLEYFCNEGDDFWNMDDKSCTDFAVAELIRMGIIDSPDCVLDSHREKVKKAYPAYFDTYNEIDKVITYINSFENLYCIGRNGQHRYNNMDHSMGTAFEAVNHILEKSTDKTVIWNVNTEKEYHETKK
jgi:protoporphyrinogen oxidase